MASDGRTIRLTAYWGFIVLGIGNTVIGPALQGILDTYHVTPAEAGALFFASSFGYFLAVLIGGPAGDRWGRGHVLQAGGALYALGFAAFAFAPSWIFAILASFVGGLGGGVIDSGTNALANDIAAPEGHAAEQSLLHSFYGLGALLGPLVVGVFLAMHAGWRPAYGLIGLSAVVLWALLARLRIPERPAAEAPINARSVATLSLNPIILALAVLLGAAVGAEVLVGDWAATFLQRVQGLDKVAAATSVGLYWGGIAAGRLLSALAARWFSGRTLLIATCVLSLVASAILPFTPNAPLALVVLVLVGLGYAAVFPLVMAVAGERFPEVTGSVAGLLIAAAAMCSTAFPWLSGILVQYVDARAALALAIPACALMLLIAVPITRTRPAVAIPLADPLPSHR